MSLVVVQWAAGRSDETKLHIRKAVSEHFGEIAQVPAKYFFVDFQDYPGIDKDLGLTEAFIWVYATEGHPQERKDSMCRLFTQDVSEAAGIDPKRIGFFFVDISKGCMGSGGKIVNKLGLVADLLREGKIKPEDIC